MSELSINPFTATAAIAHFEKESLPEPNVPVNTLAELLGERESQDQGTHTAIQSIFKTRSQDRVEIYPGVCFTVSSLIWSNQNTNILHRYILIQQAAY